MPNDSETRDQLENSPCVIAVAEESFNYAAWQNSVPLLRSVVVENPTDLELSSVTVELKVSPAFARAKSWKVDRIGAGQQVTLRDTDIEVDADYLDRLDEAVRGVLNFRLLKGDQALAETTTPVRVLARDEWGGMGSMGELLPAFVTPNDPALAPLLKSASEALGRHGHSTALDGYQSGDPNRSYMLAAALWSAVAAKSLTYANPPSSFEQVGQKTRRVATVLGDGLATCLDTTLLFASGMEAMGLNPVLVMTEGHCFAGVWLVEKTLKKLNEPDCSELRKAIVAKELIVFETTLVTHRPAAQFADAMSAAEAALGESREHEFVAAVDVSRARMSQVRPLASHGQRAEVQEEGVETGPPALPAAPGYERPAVEEEDPKPNTPAGRIERWQRKLLDLSMRNRLLNFRPTKQTVPVLCPDVSLLEDRLADGTRMRLVSLKEENTVGDRDAALHQQRTQKDLDLEFAREALNRDEVACPVEARDLDARLTALYRKVKNDLAEGGSNTLYLAVGFLRWKQNATDERTYRAPLLLVPVKLLRRSASSPFYLAHHEDDVRFNATLLQLLKKDFDCDLTSMESDLPTDDSGVDVPKVLERMRRAVRDIPGFEVVEDAAVASFSFAKYLMWKDLTERVDQLERNRVVRHLVNDPDKAFTSDGAGPMPRPHEIDTRYTPADIVHPLPADSSQLSAVMAASEGHDLVIVGPPGTGKSQTIANVIAQCLAVGKTVLFVAEKTAALDVVHRRLREHGLGDCCVELHSNKAERRRLLDQLEASWKRRARKSEGEWVQVSERLRVRRDELNDYVAAVHAKHPNGWTVYNAMGLCVRERATVTPELTWPRTVTHDRDAYESIHKSVDDLALAHGALPANANLGRLEAHEWSMAWESDFTACCSRLKEASDDLTNGVERLSRALSLPLPGDIATGQLSALYRLAHELTRQELPPGQLVLHPDLEGLKTSLVARRDLLERRDQANGVLTDALSSFVGAIGGQVQEVAQSKRDSYYRLANELVKPSPPPIALVFHKAFEKLPERLASRIDLQKRRDEAWEGVEARHFNPTLVKRIKLDELEAAWEKAAGSFWPLSTLRMGGVKKKLKAYMKSGGAAEPDVDLPLLREHQDCLDAITENLASLALPEDLEAALEKDPTSLTPLVDSARQLRDAFVAAGHSPESVGEATNNSLEPLVAAALLLYSPAREVEQLKTGLRENRAALGLEPEFRTQVEENASALDVTIEAALRLQSASATLGLTTDAVSEVLGSLCEEGRKAAADCCHSAKSFQNAWLEYTKLAGATPAATDSTGVASDAASQADRVLAGRTLLKQWTAWIGARKQAEVLGLSTFVDALQQNDFPAADAAARFRLAYARWWLPAAVDKSDTLRTFQRFRHEDAVEDFRQLDELARKAAAPRALQAIYHDLPPSDQVPRKSELGLLRHQMGLKRPSKSIREVISGMPESFGKLAPCLLMSPLSIAQYLPADQAQFDVVVFDEASQIATWDAIGAIARGKQTIIVGDPKQLPPTNFFGRADSDEENDELDDFEKDLESILDEAKASGLPTLQLNWHYRSRHESLIAFSNYHYYGNQLVTFPAAESEDRGVSLTLVEGGLYDRGKSRTNRAEAEAIVNDAVSRMRGCLDKPEKERLTYGVVTFNSQQQSLIQDLFDQALRETPELEWFFADERVEPTAVKNLENVQGDERDVMYFSITFGQNAAGQQAGKPIPVDFGAINRDGGERRLNVAVTRARQTLLVYASFLPDELRAERSSARGVHDLKAFLEYANKGPEAIAARTDGSVGEMESPFEEAVAEELKNRGWQLDPQVGVSGFRVDLGVIHPDRPGAYLAGVECDGATYHRSAAARDRDKTRQQILENLGWNILRVWSPDWWYDPETAVEALHNRLNELLESSRKIDNELSSGESNKEVSTASAPSTESEVDKMTPSADFALSDPTDGSGGEHESPFEEAVAAALQSRGWRSNPQVGVSGFRIDLGIVHPDRPGTYLAGVECDGAPYHRSAEARDQDKIRQQALEDHGWNILRLWSHDWWDNPDAAVEELHSQLKGLLKSGRESDNELSSGNSHNELNIKPVKSTKAKEDELVSPADFAEAVGHDEQEESSRPQLVAKHAADQSRQLTYRIAELEDATAEQDRFYDDDYSRKLRELTLAVVETEGPVRDDVVARRIARAHGFARTGARIKDRVLSQIPEVTVTTEDAGRFLWATAEALDKTPFRYPVPGDERRSLDEIAIEELVGLVQSQPELTRGEDPALAFAREVGLARLAKSARERLEAAIELATAEQ